jgi:hypothetical protein
MKQRPESPKNLFGSMDGRLRTHTKPTCATINLKISIVGSEISIVRVILRIIVVRMTFCDKYPMKLKLVYAKKKVIHDHSKLLLMGIYLFGYINQDNQISNSETL